MIFPGIIRITDQLIQMRDYPAEIIYLPFGNNPETDLFMSLRKENDEISLPSYFMG
jgi:hypothetical protein